jgi:mono/diheme cytochrome c family protein
VSGAASPARSAVSAATLLVLALLALLAACGGQREDGSGWDWNRMQVQPRYAAYGPSRFFSDGRAMRPPPAGTVARESSDGDVADGGVAPMPAVTAALLARGRDRFGIYCAVCHGEAMDGQSLVASNMDPPRPPALRGPGARALAPEALYAVITHGFGRMPSYASELPPPDRWAVVAWVERGTPASGSAAR